MPRPRLLVVDDSVVVRKFVSDLLAAEPTFEVVGTAANGKIALAKVEQLRPDLLVLDVEMPVMDGLETLRALKRLTPAPRVVMFSSHTQSQARTTIEALMLGAEACVAKPSGLLASQDAREAVGRELVEKIQALTAARALPSSPETPSAPAATRLPPPRIDLLAIGASTGGPNALALLFSRFPATLPVPVVVVQHMPAAFTGAFAERLARESNLAVQEAAEGDVLEPGQAWVAPGGVHLVLEPANGALRLHLSDAPPVHSCRPAVDVFFQSAEPLLGNRVLAVVLTGMGEDGLDGARAIHQAGGRVLVQDEASSVVWGMAGAVARAGLADAALPVDELGDEIVRRVRTGRPL